MAAGAARPGRRAELLAWALVVALAVALRLWMWSFQAQSGAVQPGDPEEYYRAALHLMRGGYDDAGKWLRPPLYPAFLALCFALGGIDTARALLAQAVLTGLAAPAFGWLALRLYGRRDVALLAGLAAALFVPLASFGSALFAEATFVVLVVLALAALDRAADRATIGAAVGAGLLFGAAALTRAVALSFVPAAALLAALLPAACGRRRRAGLAAGVLLGAALLVGPWALRNAAVHHRLILSDTNGGISMWYGTVRGDDEQRAGEARLWAVPNLADRQSLAVQMALANIARDPAWFVGRMRFKVASLYLLQLRSFAAGDIITISPRDELVAMGAGENPLGWSAVADAQYVLLMLLAGAGLIFAPRARRLLPAALWVGFATFMSAITIGHPRLRLPIVAALIPCAAYGALLAWRLLRRRTPAGLGRPRLRAAGLAAWCALVVALVFSTRYITWARTWPALREARAAEAQGAYGTAQAALARARALDPGNALRAIDEADLAQRRGDYESALALYGQALRLEDRSLYAHAQRERVAARLGLADVARAEQAALAGYGRDSNEVYSWAWRTFGDPPAPAVVPGDALALGQYVGFAPATPDLPAGRWTLGDSRVRVADSCGALRVRLAGPAGRRVTVEVEGRGAPQTLALAGGEQELALPLAAEGCVVGRPLVVRLRSDTSLLDIDRAPWAVGVAVLEVRAVPGAP